MTAAQGKRHRWRENVEALTMAVVIALVFKFFILAGRVRLNFFLVAAALSPAR